MSSSARLTIKINFNEKPNLPPGVDDTKTGMTDDPEENLIARDKQGSYSSEGRGCLFPG